MMLQSFDEQALLGLTLEEAVHFLTPRGWTVVVHRYEDGIYSKDELGLKEGIPTVSLDIQDGKVYELEMYRNDEDEDVCGS
jgi:hypothetical protein